MSAAKLVIMEDGKVCRVHGPHNPLIFGGYEQLPDKILENSIGVATPRERKQIMNDREPRQRL